MDGRRAVRNLLKSKPDLLFALNTLPSILQMLGFVPPQVEK